MKNVDIRVQCLGRDLEPFGAYVIKTLMCRKYFFVCVKYVRDELQCMHVVSFFNDVCVFKINITASEFWKAIGFLITLK